MLKTSVVIFLISITTIRLFTSIDPVSIRLWGKTEDLGQSVYGLNQDPSLAGFDGITYNLQFNLMVKKRSDLILGKTKDTGDCSWIFPDPNNDFKTIDILDLKNKNPNFSCFP